MKTNIEFAYCQENVEVAAYKHKHYGHGVYYDVTKESYDEAYDRASKIMWQKIRKDNPQIQWHDEKVIQVNENDSKGYITPKPFPFNHIVSVSDIPPSNEKINKGIIEEQIQAYTDAEQLKNDWEVTVKGSKKYKTVFDEKLKELEALQTT